MRGIDLAEQGTVHGYLGKEDDDGSVSHGKKMERKRREAETVMMSALSWPVRLCACMPASCTCKARLLWLPFPSRFRDTGEEEGHDGEKKKKEKKK